MNFFSATVRDGTAALADGTTMKLPGLADRGSVIIGLRPESMLPAADGAPGLVATVALVEPLGSDTLVHFRVADTGYVARVPPEPRPRVGDQLTLAIDPARAHLFDPQTGAAIGAGG